MVGCLAVRLMPANYICNVFDFKFVDFNMANDNTERKKMLQVTSILHWVLSYL